MSGLLHKASTLFDKMKTSSTSGNADIRLDYSSNSILSHDALPEVIPDNILAFRTITTLLEKIQQQRPFKLMDGSDGAHLSKPETQELKLTTAFSTVAVTDHNVVAVVAKRCLGNLEVIACTSLSHDENQPIPQPQPSSTIFRIPYLLVTQNFRRGDPRPEKQDRIPTITETEIPPGLEDGDQGLKQYLERRW
jgi:hypothetical protein